MNSDEISGIVFDCDYIVEGNKPLVRVFVKDAKTKQNIVLHDSSFCPYFYVVPYLYLTDEQAFLLKKKIELFEHDDISGTLKVKSVKEEEKTMGLQKRRVFRVECFIPKEVPLLKAHLEKEEEIEGFREYDILFYKRYLIDRNIELFRQMHFKVHHEKKTGRFFVDSIKADKNSPLVDFSLFRWLAFDLETIEESGKTKIIFASIVDSSGCKTVITCYRNGYEHAVVVEDEKSIIEKMGEIIKKQNPDFILTYNGDNFDFNVLEDRAKTFGIKLQWSSIGENFTYFSKGARKKAQCFGLVHIDIYKFVFSIMRGTIKSETLKLNNIAKELLGDEKKDVSYSDISHAWRTKTNLSKIADYCVHDSVLTLKLGEHIFANLSSLSNLVCQLPFDTCRASYGTLVEAFAIRKAHEKNIIVPNKPSNEEMVKRKQKGMFKGAFVYSPKVGLKKNIALFDFRSLYPSIIITHNIDIDTINCKCCLKTAKKKNKVPDYDFYFCQKQKGFIPSILEEIIFLRVKIKKIIKETRDTKMLKKLDAQQYALKIVANAFYGYMGFAGSRFYDYRAAVSTTSFGRHYIHKVIEEAKEEGFRVVYGDTDSVFLSLPKKNMKKINKFLDHINNSLPGIMDLEYEGFFTKGLFAQKKHGEGGAKKRYALVDENGNIIIKGFEKVRRDWSVLARQTQEKVLELLLSDKTEEAKNYVRDVIDKLKTKKVPIEELVINTNLKKSISSYEQMAPHVMAVKKAIARGMKFKGGQNIAYVVTAKGKSISDKAQLAEFANDYDSQYYINNQIIPVVSRIFEAVGVQELSLTDNSKQKNIFEY
ncbi:MAG: hypothetical protein DRN66_03110 [Candidatus Nanohalarchaeota archaeon]|nr:MAG: hypothetical protein DRN66_03110 [Candidatus Nanohaloarchaeota archaeon]